jgi:D-hydroxyproline dehydrogenase subunit beta
MLPDVVVIGGGIAGCACAYYLSLSGVRVRLLERGPLGSGASRAGMSHVVTWEEPEMHLELARASQRLYEQLCHELPGDIEYRRTGSLAVVEDPAGMEAMAAMISRLGAWGLECHLLDSAGLAEAEPALAPGMAGGAYFPGDGQVNPLYTTQALAKAARERGAVIQTGAEVTAVEVSHGRVAAVHTAAERIPAGAVVIAAGAWSGSLGQMAGVHLPIQPRKGTLVVTAPVPENMLRCKVILSAGYMDSIKSGGGGLAVAANIQQVKNGNLLLGSSRQFAGFDLRADPAAAGEIVSRCLRFVPGLANQTAIRIWSGLRPYTPDLLPVIGPVSAVGGLYVAAGHEGIGITEGPVTGLLISQMITGQPVEIPVGTLSPDRFHKEDQQLI